MTNRDYVTFPTAKLLKAAGFNQKTRHGYTDDGLFLEYSADYPAPHLWHAMKWLREEHRINSMINYQFYRVPPGWAASIRDMNGKVAIKQDSLWKLIKDEHDLSHAEDIIFPTYESACDAGIAAACKWLIKDAEIDDACKRILNETH